VVVVPGWCGACGVVVVGGLWCPWCCGAVVPVVLW